MAAVIFLAASIAGAAEAYAMSGEGTSESPYKIQNDEDRYGQDRGQIVLLQKDIE